MLRILLHYLDSQRPRSRIVHRFEDVIFSAQLDDRLLKTSALSMFIEMGSMISSHPG